MYCGFQFNGYDMILIAPCRISNKIHCVCNLLTWILLVLTSV